jgi:hypothetical protein
MLISFCSVLVNYPIAYTDPKGNASETSKKHNTDMGNVLLSK